MKPILFNTEMVRAILSGRKMVTRRVVKPQPVCYGPNITFDPHDDFFLSKEKNWLRCRVCGHDPEYSRSESNIAHHWVPPYHPGDILYVRETWYYETFYEDTDNAPDLPSGNGSWRYVYKSDNPDYPVIPGHWCPSIHMPREAARIFLRVTDVRVERLQDITPDQIDAEGCKEWAYSAKTGEILPSGPSWFRIAWDNTLKPKDRALYGWEADPWVWVVAFEKVSREEALSCPLTT